MDQEIATQYSQAHIKRLLSAGAQMVTDDKIAFSAETVKIVNQTAGLFQKYFTTLVCNNVQASRKNVCADHIYSTLDDMGVAFIRRQVITRAVELNRVKWVRKAQSDPDAVLNKPVKKAKVEKATTSKKKDDQKLVSLTKQAPVAESEDDDEEEESEDDEDDEDEEASEEESD